MTTFVSCPMCSREIPAFRINDHIDLDCSGSSEKSLSRDSIQADPMIEEGARDAGLAFRPSEDIEGKSDHDQGEGPSSQEPSKEEDPSSTFFSTSICDKQANGKPGVLSVSRRVRQQPPEDHVEILCGPDAELLQTSDEPVTLPEDTSAELISLSSRDTSAPCNPNRRAIQDHTARSGVIDPARDTVGESGSTTNGDENSMDAENSPLDATAEPRNAKAEPRHAKEEHTRKLESTPTPTDSPCTSYLDKLRPSVPGTRSAFFHLSIEGQQWHWHWGEGKCRHAKVYDEADDGIDALFENMTQDQMEEDDASDGIADPGAGAGMAMDLGIFSGEKENVPIPCDEPRSVAQQEQRQQQHAGAVAVQQRQLVGSSGATGMHDGGSLVSSHRGGEELGMLSRGGEHSLSIFTKASGGSMHAANALHLGMTGQPGARADCGAVISSHGADSSCGIMAREDSTCFTTDDNAGVDGDQSGHANALATVSTGLFATARGSAIRVRRENLSKAQQQVEAHGVDVEGGLESRSSQGTAGTREEKCGAGEKETSKASLFATARGSTIRVRKENLSKAQQQVEAHGVDVDGGVEAVSSQRTAGTREEKCEAGEKETSKKSLFATARGSTIRVRKENLSKAQQQVKAHGVDVDGGVARSAQDTTLTDLEKETSKASLFATARGSTIRVRKENLSKAQQEVEAHTVDVDGGLEARSSQAPAGTEEEKCGAGEQETSKTSLFATARGTAIRVRKENLSKAQQQVEVGGGLETRSSQGSAGTAVVCEAGESSKASLFATARGSTIRVRKENLSKAQQQVKAHGVDVDSGVETCSSRDTTSTELEKETSKTSLFATARGSAIRVHRESLSKAQQEVEAHGVDVDGGVETRSSKGGTGAEEEKYEQETSKTSLFATARGSAISVRKENLSKAQQQVAEKDTTMDSGSQMSGCVPAGTSPFDRPVQAAAPTASSVDKTQLRFMDHGNTQYAIATPDRVQASISPAPVVGGLQTSQAQASARPRSPEAQNSAGVPPAVDFSVSSAASCSSTAIQTRKRASEAMDDSRGKKRRKVSLEREVESPFIHPSLYEDSMATCAEVTEMIRDCDGRSSHKPTSGSCSGDASSGEYQNDLVQCAWRHTVSISDADKHGRTSLSVCADVWPTTAADLMKPTLRHNQRNSRGPTLRFPPSVLKSILQKNIRRCRPYPAVRAALALMKESFVDFVRRLGILCCEDVVLHPAFPLVVWLTAAASAPSGKFVLTTPVVNTLLRIVFELASVNVRDPVPPDLPPRSVPCLGSLSLSNADENALIKSLIARAAFGGMKCDVQLLHTMANVWCDRFEGRGRDPPVITHGIVPYLQNDGDVRSRSPWLSYLHDLYSPCARDSGNIVHENVGPLQPGDIPLAAIDFHCSPMMGHLFKREGQVRMVIFEHMNRFFKKQRTQEDVEGLVKRMVWYFSSSRNNKALLFDVPEHSPKELDEIQRLQPLWQQLQKVVESFAKHYIQLPTFVVH
eukprot:TRINITY_DN4425_c0_g1_i3.p1 TRINITY_DN4425_c0_g1~~TRINITY_DN4425_c0_g1_i3.p1  ORF type:complete len:1491 (+),score=173.74 TRINITY_DN4425_c0_g1_i3:926-5398(+)